MDNPDPTAVIILSELVFIETVVIIGLLATLFIKKRKRGRLLAEQAAKIKDAAEARQAELKQTFQRIPGLSDTQLTAATAAMVDQELVFYKFLVDGWYQSKPDDAANLQQAVGELLAPYSQLIPSTDAEAAEATQEEAAVPDVDDAIDALLADPEPEAAAEAPAEADPAFDLSEEAVPAFTEDETDSTPEIAEIPDDLLDADSFPDDAEKHEATK